jgi:hypothetical protein
LTGVDAGESKLPDQFESSHIRLTPPNIVEKRSRFLDGCNHGAMAPEPAGFGVRTDSICTNKQLVASGPERRKARLIIARHVAKARTRRGVNAGFSVKKLTESRQAGLIFCFSYPAFTPQRVRLGDIPGYFH